MQNANKQKSRELFQKPKPYTEFKSLKEVFKLLLLWTK